MSNASVSSDSEICGFYEGYTLQRFIIITGLSTISVFGILANLLLLAVFRRSLPSSIFLASLSVCDTLICLTYLLLFGVDAAIMYLKNTALFFLYHSYIVPVFFIAKVTQFAIPFVLILITFERYLWTCPEDRRQIFSAIFSERGRNSAVFFVFFVSVALRVPVLFATKVVKFENCPDYFRSESVDVSEWAKDSEVYHIFDFHVITAIQMFFPFFVLLILNFTIIQRMIAEKREMMFPVCVDAKKKGDGSLPENYVLLQVAADVIKESLLNKSSRSKRSQLRNAIYTMIAIVTSYLICNGVHLFLTILERFDPSYLYESDDRGQSSTFYIILSDTVSCCYMIASAVRILIYAKCNSKLRKEIVQYCRRGKIEIAQNS